MPRQMSLAVVGADYPNRRGPGRRFEIAICAPGEPVELRPEPNNPADPRAVAVYSCRGVQIGYLTAERAPLIGRDVREGRIRTIFQRAERWGATIRAAFDGAEPALPAGPIDDTGDWPPPGSDDSDWWPD